MQMDCTPWPGHLMASTLLLRREAVLITMQITQCAYGMPSAEILSISIAVILTMYLPWPGRPMGSKSHRLHRVTQCQCGKRDESGILRYFQRLRTQSIISRWKEHHIFALHMHSKMKLPGDSVAGLVKR